jgi:hypothetical protein
MCRGGKTWICTKYTQEIDQASAQSGVVVVVVVGEK